VLHHKFLTQTAKLLNLLQCPFSGQAATDTKNMVTAKYPNHVWHVDLTIVPILGGLWTSWLPFALPPCWPFSARRSTSGARCSTGRATRSTDCTPWAKTARGGQILRGHSLHVAWAITSGGLVGQWLGQPVAAAEPNPTR
jgi:hypothetical protein